MRIYTKYVTQYDKNTGTWIQIKDECESYEYAGDLALCGGGGGQQQTAPPQTTTTIQKSDPWDKQQPFLETGFQRAEQDILNDPPAYFPNSTVIPFSNETQTALDNTAARAMLGSPINQQAKNELVNTLGGNYLYGGDGFNAAIDAASRRILPKVNSQFELSGRTNSGLAQEAQTRAITDAFAEQYQQERANQMRSLFFAPQIAEADYNDYSRLAAVGAQKESLQQEYLADQIARHDFEQMIDTKNLFDYMNLIQGNYGGTTTSTGQQSGQTFYRGGDSGMGGIGMGLSLLGSIFGGGGGGLLGGLFGGLF